MLKPPSLDENELYDVYELAEETIKFFPDSKQVTSSVPPLFHHNKMV